jgi:hypothetical protein
MPTYWIDTPQAWAADKPLHAHMTRRSLQDNAQAAYEQSGSDLDGGILCLSAGYYTLGTTGGVWAWQTLVPPHPVRVLRAQGDAAWRSITIEWLAAMAVGGTSMTARVFALPTPIIGLDLASGLCGPYPYAVLPFNAAGAPSRKDDTLTPTEVGSVSLNGETFPVVYLHTAINGDGDLRVYSTRRKEGI